LAKLLAGGYPGAAVVGKAEVMSVMEYRDVPGGVSPPAVPHQGTFNGVPFVAAAGIATLKLIRSSDAIDRANRNAEVLRRELNAVIRKMGIGWSVYGDFSSFHIFTNAERAPVTADDIQSGKVHWAKLKAATRMDLVYKIRAGLLLGGVDICVWPGGWTSAVLAAGDIDKTVAAFEQLLRMLAEEGEVS
jgi:glutamate-1-semialdehyde 2,1-aminomutase